MVVAAAACVGAGVSCSSTFTTSHCLLWPQQATRHPGANRSLLSFLTSAPTSIPSPATSTPSSLVFFIASACSIRSVRSRGGVAAAAMSSSPGAVATTSLAEGIRVVEGNGGLPLVKLTSPRGSEAEIYLFGGCITSWRVPNGKDLLFVRPDAVFDKKKPISGGIPHCFPQFGPGPMQQHGFARNLDWSIAGSESVEGDPVITLELKDSPYSRAMWDFSFQALYKVTINAKSLSTVLTVTNTDNKPFAFSSALHTYFHASIKDVSVKGLLGCKTLNKDPDPSNPLEGVEERGMITFPGFVDCVYLDAPSELHLDNGLNDIITIQNKGWSDAVLWNPYLQMEHCYKDFVCVENAKIAKVQLEPDQSWIAEQHISVN